MGWTIGMPSLKLNNVGNKSKACGSFGAVASEALSERQGRDPDIDKSRSNDNICIGFQSAAELQEYSKKHVEELSKKQLALGGRKIRDDAVVMCATIIKPPAAFMNSLERQDQVRFLTDSLDKLGDIVGKDNIKSAVLHFDEQGAHLHAFWEPMTPDGRLCAKEQHSLKFLGRLNREMPEHLRACGWDIDNCRAYDQAKEELRSEKEKAELRAQQGRSSAAYKADAEREKNIALEQLDEIKGKQDALEARFKAFSEPAATLNDLEHIKESAKPKRRILSENDVILKQSDYTQLVAQASHGAKVDIDNKDLRERIDNLEANKSDLERRHLELYRERDTLERENKELRNFCSRAKRFLEENHLVERFKAWIQDHIKSTDRGGRNNDDERTDR